jgi:hypothetical protein
LIGEATEGFGRICSASKQSHYKPLTRLCDRDSKLFLHQKNARAERNSLKEHDVLTNKVAPIGPKMP